MLDEMTPYNAKQEAAIACGPLEIEAAVPIFERWYIAGPMTGYPMHNYQAFREAADRLRREGYTIVSPHEINAGLETEDGAPEATDVRRLCLERDIEALLICQGVFVLEGWWKSNGATLEVHIGHSLGMPIRYAADPHKRVVVTSVHVGWGLEGEAAHGKD